MVLYPIVLSQSWSTTVPNFMLVSGKAQSGQNLALIRLATIANSVDPDQTAPIGAVCSGSKLFAPLLNSSVMLGNYL